MNDQEKVLGIMSRGTSEMPHLFGASSDALKALLDQPELPLDKPPGIGFIKLKTLAQQGDIKAQTLLFLFWKKETLWKNDICKCI